MFIKPVRAGSSYGITKVTGSEQLSAAVELAFQYDDHIILEEAIFGFEVGCAVLGNEALLVGEPDEIEESAKRIYQALDCQGLPVWISF